MITLLVRLVGSVRDAHLSVTHRAEHIMAMPASVPPPNRLRKSWTADEVRRLITESPLATPRYELVDGDLLVTPSPTGPHQRAVALLLQALMTYFERNPVADVYISPFDVELEPGSIVQPDVFVVPLGESRRLLAETPARELLVAAEVLSPSSGRHDKVAKRLLYGRHVPEYWIVDLDARIIERWRPNDERPGVLVTLLEWPVPSATEPFRLHLPKYFAAVFRE
jgi:Uma2 family endonuclease